MFAHNFIHRLIAQFFLNASLMPFCLLLASKITFAITICFFSVFLFNSIHCVLWWWSNDMYLVTCSCYFLGDWMRMHRKAIRFNVWIERKLKFETYNMYFRAAAVVAWGRVWAGTHTRMYMFIVCNNMSGMRLNKQLEESLKFFYVCRLHVHCTVYTLHTHSVLTDECFDFIIITNTTQSTRPCAHSYNKVYRRSNQWMKRKSNFLKLKCVEKGNEK